MIFSIIGVKIKLEKRRGKSKGKNKKPVIALCEKPAFKTEMFGARPAQAKPSFALPLRQRFLRLSVGVLDERSTRLKQIVDALQQVVNLDAAVDPAVGAALRQNFPDFFIFAADDGQHGKMVVLAFDFFDQFADRFAVVRKPVVMRIEQKQIGFFPAQQTHQRQLVFRDFDPVTRTQRQIHAHLGFEILVEHDDSVHSCSPSSPFDEPIDHENPFSATDWTKCGLPQTRRILNLLIAFQIRRGDVVAPFVPGANLFSVLGG
jgi:hypothetical protein